MNSKFTEKAEKALGCAHTSAERLGHTYIGTEHLLLALASDEGSLAAIVLIRAAVTKERVEAAIKDFCGFGAKSSLFASDMTPRLRRAIEGAYRFTQKYDSLRIGTEHLLFALMEERDSVAARILASLEVDTVALKDEVQTLLRATDMKAKRSDTKEKPKLQSLSKYGKNLTMAAESFDPLIGRESEIERIIRVLSRKTKNNPCLVGEAGVGKTAIVEGLAKRIREGSVPERLRSKEIYSLDLTSVVAGAKYRGDFEERISAIIDEAVSDPSVILFIDEIHTIVGAGAAEGAIDAANILKPKLARAEIQLIGATTNSEYRRYIEKDSALERRFQPIVISEPSAEKTVEILHGIKEKYEEHHGIVIEDEAIRAAVALSERYINDRHMPDKAIDLIDEACAKCVLEAGASDDKKANTDEKLKQILSEKEKAVCSLDFERAAGLRELELIYKENLRNADGVNQGKAKTPVLSARGVEAVVSELVGASVSYGDTEDVSKLSDYLSGEVIGQKLAIARLSEAIVRNKLGMLGDSGPLGVFMLVGESGTGKTALAAALARGLFGSERFLIRFDMSEFSENTATSKFIGTAPGYVGYDDGSSVLERVRQSPYSVVLFDEMEKASSEVKNLFLQIADNGKITDSHGREVSFKNTYVIITSNATAKEGAAAIGFGADTADGDISSRLSEHFSTEFLARIDEIIHFSTPKYSDLERIVNKTLSELRSRLCRFGIDIEVDEGMAGYIAALGKKRGAVRNILSFIKQNIENKIAVMIARGECEREDTVFATLSSGEVEFSVKKRSFQ